jgi:hypothetical protein
MDEARLRLSKSKIASFEHCPKRLWLQAHRREVGSVDQRTQALFSAGHGVGELARDQLPNGILVHEDHRDVEGAIAHTKALLSGPWDRPIFEAAFQREDVVVRADILQPDGRGGWSFIEVKNATSVQPYILNDVATQGWAALGDGLRISSFAVRHVRRKMRGETDLSRCIFIDTDVTWLVLGLIPRRLTVIKAARECIRGPEPDRPPGPYCTRPFICEFRDYCRSAATLKMATSP